MFPSATAVVFLGRPVRCLLLSMPAVSFFFRTFQVVVQAIPNDRFLSFSELQNGLLFSQRQLSGLHVGLSFLTQTQSSQTKPKAKTKSRHSELFIVYPINLTGHMWATRNTCQSHVPILLLT